MSIILSLAAFHGESGQRRRHAQQARISGKDQVRLFGTRTFSPAVLHAQPTFDYGTAAELKAVKRIYIYTGPEMEVRQNIIKNIRKDLPDIIVAERAEEAQVHLVFTADTSSYIAGVTHGQQSSSVKYRTVIHGKGLVIAPQPDGRLRLLMEFGDSRGTLFERRPSTNFARAFVKAFKAANGTK